MNHQRIRSKLFVPGNRPAWMTKALTSGADGLVLDLEDAVPDEEKSQARTDAAEFITNAGGQETAIFVRINDLTTSAALRDLRAVVRPGLSGIMVPKVNGPKDVHVVDALVTWLEADAGIEPGSITLTPVLETASGIRDARLIGAASPRIAYMGGLGVKGGDVERAIGFRWSAGGSETFVLRSQVLLDVRAAGVPNPMSGLWTDVSDLEGLRAFAEQNRSIGYEGMVAIHPSHIPVVNAVFGQSQSELDHYRGLLGAMEEARSRGTSATTYRGQMVDTAMAKTAAEFLTRARTPGNP